ncbi:hypothetical protein N6H14_32200 [Paenibacillus sp. CC-CFT747]|nr:hypothetical protein N6H14_32200 [Paenibacillus sp. CC-CFT747]
MEEYRVGGVSVLKSGAFCPLVLEDADDSWGQVHSFRKLKGRFKRMSKAKAARYSGLRGKPIEAVRVIEDGAARTVVETLFEYGDSMLCLRYGLPKRGTEVRVDLTVHWNEKRSLLKLSVPTTLSAPEYWGQVAYGADRLPSGGKEAVAQKWTAAVSQEDGVAFTCINDGIYGSDMADGEIRLTLLRSPGYSVLPGGKMPFPMPRDRFSDRMDQGERTYSFWLNAGPLGKRMNSVDREALSHNEKPYALTYFPPGNGTKPAPLVRLSDETVLMTAFKQAEDEKSHYILRLFEPTGTARSTSVELPSLGIGQTVSLKPFEIKTYRIRTLERTMEEVSLIEEPMER